MGAGQGDSPAGVAPPPASHSHLDPTPIRVELLSAPRPEGGALTAVFLALAAVFWEWRVGSARI